MLEDLEGVRELEAAYGIERGNGRMISRSGYLLDF